LTEGILSSNYWASNVCWPAISVVQRAFDWAMALTGSGTGDNFAPGVYAKKGPDFKTTTAVV